LHSTWPKELNLESPSSNTLACNSMDKNKEKPCPSSSCHGAASDARPDAFTISSCSQAKNYVPTTPLLERQRQRLQLHIATTQRMQLHKTDSRLSTAKKHLWRTERLQATVGRGRGGALVGKCREIFVVHLLNRGASRFQWVPKAIGRQENSVGHLLAGRFLI